mgnify:CR=1 FL=1|jgi:hypothetical protein
MIIYLNKDKVDFSTILTHYCGIPDSPPTLHDFPNFNLLFV